MIQQMTQKKQQRNKGQRAWGRLKNLPHKFFKKNLKKYLHFSETYYILSLVLMSYQSLK